MIPAVAVTSGNDYVPQIPPWTNVFNGIPSSHPMWGGRRNYFLLVNDYHYLKMVIPSRNVTPILPFHFGASFNTVIHFPLISPINFCSSDPCMGFGYVADFGGGSQVNCCLGRRLWHG